MMIIDNKSRIVLAQWREGSPDLLSPIHKLLYELQHKVGDCLALLLGCDIVASKLHLRDVEEAGGYGFTLFLREEGPAEDQAA
jgi:hypothetical protein